MTLQTTKSVTQKKKKEEKLRPYQEIHNAIMRGRARRSKLAFTIILCLATAIGVFFITDASFTLVEQIASSLIVFFTGVSLILMIFLVRENISASEKEENLVNTVIIFLKEQMYSDEILKTIDKRAEIGSSAGQTRTLFQMLSIPFITSIAAYLYGIPIFIELFVVCSLILFFFTLSLLVETGRANSDIIIRHAIAEYQYLESQAQITVNQDTGSHNNQRIYDFSLACCFLVLLRWFIRR
ncbi:MAG TPA: hypothetical protein VFS21_27510 [Roseiflexaceae bacterium]|nr:hypothetical protein [Roseiflexaceae bacterium]